MASAMVEMGRPSKQRIRCPIMLIEPSAWLMYSGSMSQHGWVLLAPAVPHCTPDIEPKHFKIGEKSIELRDETVGPNCGRVGWKGWG